MMCASVCEADSRCQCAWCGRPVWMMKHLSWMSWRLGGMEGINLCAFFIYFFFPRRTNCARRRTTSHMAPVWLLLGLLSFRRSIRIFATLAHPSARCLIFIFLFLIFWLIIPESCAVRDGGKSLFIFCALTHHPPLLRCTLICQQ